MVRLARDRLYQGVGRLGPIRVRFWEGMCSLGVGLVTLGTCMSHMCQYATMGRAEVWCNRALNHGGMAVGVGSSWLLYLGCWRYVNDVEIFWSTPTCCVYLKAGIRIIFDHRSWEHYVHSSARPACCQATEKRGKEGFPPSIVSYSFDWKCSAPIGMVYRILAWRARWYKGEGQDFKHHGGPPHISIELFSS